MSKIKTGLFIFLIFLVGFLLRIAFLHLNSLTFSYDQARDAFTTTQILHGDLKIQGPPSSAPGLFHGVLYDYFLAPAYALGKSPINAAYFLTFENSLAIIIVFALGYFLTKKVWVGIISSLLFAFSFEGVQYATWLSNPSLAVLTVPIMYLGLWLWISGKNKWAPVIAAVGLGLSIQSEIFLAYQALPLIIWLWVSKEKITKKQVFVFLAVLFLILSSFALSEIKFGFKGVNGVKNLLSSNQQNLAYAPSIGDFVILYFNQIGRIFAFNIFPVSIFYGGLSTIVLAIFYIFKKDKVGIFLSTWLFSHISVVSIGGTSTPFLMVGIGPAVVLLWGVTLYKMFEAGRQKLAALLLIIFILADLLVVFKENPNGSTLFSIQKDMNLKNELAVIDFTYHEAGGQMFSVNSLTSPLWINIVWTYLYKWYGEKNYRYIPEWHGRDQIGQLDSLPITAKNTKLYFLIIEPMEGIPNQYLGQTIQEEDGVSMLIKEQSFGQIRVQERIRK